MSENGFVFLVLIFLLLIFLLVKFVKWITAPMPDNLYVENPNDPIPMWRYRSRAKKK